MGAQNEATLQLALLGRPEIRIDEELLADGLPAKGVALLAYLAVTGQPATREALAGLLWGESPDAAARASLRVTLNRLPAALRPFLQRTRTTLALDPARLALDVDMLTNAAAGPPAAWQTAVSLYRGSFLDGFSVPDAPAFEEWTLLARERLRLLALDLLQRLAADALERQAYAEGIAHAQRLLALDSWREEAHRLLMRLLALDGRRSDALAQFETCRRLLAENLGVAPTAETQTLHETIRLNRLAPPASANDAPAPPHNLPAGSASFVGRETELAQLTALLAQPDGRLLTILGPGGAGKTRLALETAARHLADSRFADGLFFVSLADLPPGVPIAPAIAEAIGLALRGGAPPEAQLRQHLRERRLLLLLDNFEHLLPQASLVADLLAAAPGLRVVVTSRERLNLYEEWLLEIGGLALPPAAAADWAAYGAPRLFVERARRVYLSFDPAAERAAILRICALVGGLPLALELAAAWVRTIPCREIAAAIARHLDFLSGAARNAPARQRSLRAAFAYSWDLLGAAERRLLPRLAVFRGGFDGAAARAVAAAAGETAGGAGLRRLSALVDKSLVQRQPNGRYQLHEAIRLFAEERAAAADWAQVRAAHARYYADFWAAQGSKHGGPEAEAAFRALGVEVENGRFAWQWALAGWPETADLLGRMLPHLSLFYLRRGRSLEAVDWLAEAADGAADGAAGAPLLAARLQHQLAKHEEALGRFAAARTRLLAHLPALEADANQAYAADAWETLGRAQRHLGDLAAAETAFQRSLALHRAVGRPSSIAGVLNALGVLAKNGGRYAEAEAFYGESLAIFRAQADRAGVAICLINLGNIANVRGDYARARAHYEEGHALTAAAEDRPNMAICLLNLGSVAAATGDAAAAERYFADSLALGREMGRGVIVATALNGLGQAQLAGGNLAAARGTLREALETAVGLQAEGMILTVLGAIGRALLLGGEAQGARLLRLAAGHANTPHYVQEELAAFAAGRGVPLAIEERELAVAEGVRLAYALLAPGSAAEAG